MNPSINDGSRSLDARSTSLHWALILALLTLGAWSFYSSLPLHVAMATDGEPAEGDVEDAAGEAESVQEYYTVELERDGEAVIVVLREDYSVVTSGGGAYGTWDQPEETENFTISSGESDWLLLGMVDSAEGDSGEGSWRSDGGTATEATWTLSEVHPIAYGVLNYNLEVVEDFVLDGNFTPETSPEGVEVEIAVGDGNVIHVYGPAGAEEVRVESGAEVYIDGEVGVLVIQNPQGKDNKVKQDKAGRKVPIVGPCVYNAGFWKVAAVANGCAQGNEANAAGMNCGKAGANCLIYVELTVGAIKLPRLHRGGCNNAANRAKKNGNGTLSVNF